MRLIDADALLEELKACDFVASSIIGDGDTLLFEDDVIKRIKGMPTAEKVGKWKYETMRHIITGEMRTVRICSECGGGWFRYDLSDGVEDAEPNYCPNCGARMRGDGDE